MRRISLCAALMSAGATWERLTLLEGRPQVCQRQRGTGCWAKDSGRRHRGGLQQRSSALYLHSFVPKVQSRTLSLFRGFRYNKPKRVEFGTNQPAPSFNYPCPTSRLFVNRFVSRVAGELHVTNAIPRVLGPRTHTRAEFSLPEANSGKLVQMFLSQWLQICAPAW